MLSFMDLLEKYGYVPTDEEIAKSLDMIAKNGVKADKDVLSLCFSAMDLTTLNPQDTPLSVAALVDKVNAFEAAYPQYPLPASICVYSNFADVVSSNKNNADLHTTVVSACFPSSQSFLEVKLLECKMAVLNGADEVDIVLALNSFMAGDYDAAAHEIRKVRETIDDAGSAMGKSIVLKVILETGVIASPALIARASFLAMEAGADFIKTSTGKVSVNATPMAAFVMCNCIKRYTEVTGRMVGFKPAGGMSTADDALVYYNIVKAVLGDKWLDKKYFRLGVSRMANNLLSALENKQVSAF